MGPRILLVLGVLAWTASVAAAQTEVRIECFDAPPRYFLENGTIHGVCIDILRYIEEKSKLRFTYPELLVPQIRLEEDLRTASIDMVLGWSLTSERQKEFIVGENAFSSPPVCIACADDPVAVGNLPLSGSGRRGSSRA